MHQPPRQSLTVKIIKFRKLRQRLSRVICKGTQRLKTDGILPPIHKAGKVTTWQGGNQPFGRAGELEKQAQVMLTHNPCRKTCASGEFAITNTVDASELVFSFVGYETKQINL
jgi:hypothetical protein